MFRAILKRLRGGVRQRLTIESWYYVVVGGFLLVGSLLREINLMLMLVGLMVGPLVLSWWMAWRSLRKIEVRRTAPSAVTAGDAVFVEIEAANRRPRGTSWAVVVKDRLRRSGDGDGNVRAATITARTFFQKLPAGAIERRTYQGTIVRRGRYELGPLVVSTRFPLGLVYRAIEVDAPATMLVLPRLGRLSPQWVRRKQMLGIGSRPERSRRGLLEGEFHTLRTYQPGDSRRWIHWRTSARRGELMVRQFEAQRHHDLALLLDLWQPETPKTEQLENVELAVSFAATVVFEHCRAGTSRLTLGIAGKEAALVSGQASAALARSASEALALAEADDGQSLAEILDRALPRSTPRSDLVIVTTRRLDLDEDENLAALRRDAWRWQQLREALCVRTDNDEVLEWFQPQ
ncbi:MAG: DUF58 domain-containing protein [Planctomycetia bacterium]|nr:DUF58 domain-containing protein [Planctomycetia bacterium]